MMRPPKNLSREAKKLWKRLQHEYAIGDEGGLLVLQTAMEAFDRMRDCQKKIEAEGMTITDRFKQVKAHPLCAVERDARAAMMAAMKSLNLDLEPVKQVGRPGGK
jgi:P27 family predicted phage terminase small subunit